MRQVLAVAGGEKGLSLFNGKVILPTTKSEVKSFRSEAAVDDVVAETTKKFQQVCCLRIDNVTRSCVVVHLTPVCLFCR